MTKSRVTWLSSGGRDDAPLVKLLYTHGVRCYNISGACDASSRKRCRYIGSITVFESVQLYRVFSLINRNSTVLISAAFGAALVFLVYACGVLSAGRPSGRLALGHRLARVFPRGRSSFRRDTLESARRAPPTARVDVFTSPT